MQSFDTIFALAADRHGGECEHEGKKYKNGDDSDNGKGPVDLGKFFWIAFCKAQQSLVYRSLIRSKV